MKSWLLVPLLIPAALSAGVPMTGNGSYQQNFNAFPAASALGWSQGTTLPSWYAHRTVAGAVNLLSVTNGSGSFTAALYNMGVTGSTDRSLGSAPTTSHGEYSTVLILTNTSANAVRIDRVAYNLEIYRTNQSLSTPESLTFSWRKSTSEAALVAALNAIGALSGYTTDAGLSFPAISFSGAGMPASAGQVSPPVSLPRSAPPSTTVMVNPGESIALRWENINEANADAYLAIDDVRVDWVEVPCALTPVVSNLARQENGTPSNPADDTWSFDYRVDAVGGGNQGWALPALGHTGSYGSTRSVTLPIGQNPMSLVLNDVQKPDCIAQVTVAAPPVLAAYVKPGQPQGITFQPAPDGSRAYTRTSTHSDLSWTWPFTRGSVGVRTQPGSPALPARYFDFNNEPTYSEAFTEVVNLTEAGGPVKVRVFVGAFTEASSGMESNDAIYATVYYGDSPNNLTGYTSPVYEPRGDEVFPEVRSAVPGVNYGVQAGQNPFPTGTFTFREYSTYLPAGISHAQVRFAGINDAQSEHWLVGGIRFESAVCEVQATMGALSRQNPHSDELDPSGDVVTPYLYVNNPVPGPSAFWRAYKTPGGTSFFGSYWWSGEPVGPYPAAAPFTLRVEDYDDPACFTLLTVTPPQRGYFGTVQARGITKPIITPMATQHAPWTPDEPGRTLSLHGINHVSNAITLESHPVSLPGSGTLWVSGAVQVDESSANSNFEAADFLWITARCATPTGEQLVPLLTRYDRNGDGRINGYGQGALPEQLVEYQANVQWDELNLKSRHYTASYTDRLLIHSELPANTTAVSIILTGNNGGSGSTVDSEIFTISGLRITEAEPANDWDADGQDDYAELLTGTDPFDANSLTAFTTSSLSHAEGNFEFDATLPTKPGVFYGVYLTGDFLTWYLLGTPLAGDGSEHAIHLSDDEPGTRVFFKVVARPVNSFPLSIP